MSAPPVVEGVDLTALNYTTLIPYNETISTGGNSLVQDLNVHYQVCLFSACLMSPPSDVVILGRRYRVDAHVYRSRLTHDSWCWVSPYTT